MAASDPLRETPSCAPIGASLSRADLEQPTQRVDVRSYFSRVGWILPRQTGTGWNHGAERGLATPGSNGDPGGIRTHDPVLRRHVLYPAELPGHAWWDVLGSNQ